MFKDINLCVENMITIQGSIFNIIWGPRNVLLMLIVRVEEPIPYYLRNFAPDLAMYTLLQFFSMYEARN